MVSVCLPSVALSQYLLSYLGFSYLGHRVSLHGCSSKVQPLLLTLGEEYLLTRSSWPWHGVAPLSPPVPAQPLLLGHWKDWCWSWNSNTLATSCEELTHWKRPWCWEELGAGEEGEREDEMAGWHHWLDGHEFEWTPAVGDGQGGLACCNSWGRKESDTTERLKWTELNWTDSWFLLLLYLEKTFQYFF